MHRLYRNVVLFACFAATSAWSQDCAVLKNASQQDIARGEGTVLLKSMVAACKSQTPEEFFRLQTSGIQRSVSGVQDKKGLLANYCKFTTETMRALGENADAGKHSIGPYKNKMMCGAPASYWFIHANDGSLALRLEVAIEAGQLKIATH